MPSNRLLNRDAARLVEWLEDERKLSTTEEECLRRVVEHILAHRPYMERVGRTLSEIAGDISPAATVTMRVKRVGSAIRKLQREKSMKLIQMADLGGCRLTPVSARERPRLLKAVARQWPHCRIRDYAACPRETGYRAVHVIVREGGHRIEIQIRTETENRWADAVERAESVLGLPGLKAGDSPATDVLAYFRAEANALAAKERGETDAQAESDIQALWPKIRHHWHR